MQVRVGLVRGLLLRVPRQRALANLGDDNDGDEYDDDVDYEKGRRIMMRRRMIMMILF